jgi:hypothetical protein
MEENKELLYNEIANIFRDVMKEIFKRENNEDSYMKQTILGTRFRAFWAILTAFKHSFNRMYKVLALAIAVHRNDNHEEDKSKTISKLTRSMSGEDITKADSRGGWVV